MFASITSGTLHGLNSYLMQVEVDVSDGLPMFNMVGLLATEVREAGERVRVALRNTGIELPPKHITVNFSPADIRKSGVGVDLPVALGILTALGNLKVESLQNTVVLGELGLDGDVKKIRGVLPLVRKAREEGYKTCILPAVNANEGAVVTGMKIVGVGSLAEALWYLSAEETERDSLIEPACTDVQALFTRDERETELDFADINGQGAVKRAIEIAAAGFHHILMIGAPGAGKSMIAKRIPTILPPLSEDEAIEVSTIYSVAGLLDAKQALITKRPFLSPHHTITETALAGGGRVPTPGTISLSHRGVLFLDEMAEFSSKTLDIMRQPLEDKCVRIARSTGTYTYPADYMMVGATNPCKCGYYPDHNKCRCTEKDIKRYLSHISGPLLDRIDLCIETPRVDVTELNGRASGNETSKQIRERVVRAHSIQRKRFVGSKIHFNAEMNPMQISRYCRLGEKELALLERLYRHLDLSARSYHKLIKVARTIADLAGAEAVECEHITEASCYRMAEQSFWKGRE